MAIHYYMGRAFRKWSITSLSTTVGQLSFSEEEGSQYLGPFILGRFLLASDSLKCLGVGLDVVLGA